MLIQSHASMRWVVRWCVLLSAFHLTLGHAAAGQESVRISQVGEWAWDIRDGDTINRIFKYDGLLISGELTIQEYKDALTALKPSLEPDEHPSLLRTRNNPKDANFGFLTVDTVYAWDHERGRVLYLQKVDGTFKVVGVSHWIA